VIAFDQSRFDLLVGSLGQGRRGAANTVASRLFVALWIRPMKIDKAKFDALLKKTTAAKPVPRTSVKATSKRGHNDTFEVNGLPGPRAPKISGQTDVFAGLLSD